MRLLTYILAILLFLPVKARGEAIDTPVEPLLLYKAKQDVRWKHGVCLFCPDVPNQNKELLQ